MELEISEHAKSRFLERADSAKIGNKSVESMIRKMCSTGNEIRPILGALKLINNNFEPATYFQSNGFVFVVVKNTVKTVYKYEKNKWKQLKK